METIRIVTNGVLCTLGLWGHTTLTVAVQLLSIFIWPFSKKWYYAFHSHIMRQWSQNLFQIMKIFAPGELIITFDDSITNDLEDDNENEALEQLLTRNIKGQVTGISFPERLIMISNHQVTRRNLRLSWNTYNLLFKDLCGLDLYLVFSLFIKGTWCIKDYA
jgi:hypothetical protein